MNQSCIYVEERKVSELASDALDNIISYREEKKKELHQKWLVDKNEKTWWRNIFGYPKYDDSYEGVKKYYYSLDVYNYAFFYAENAHKSSYNRLKTLAENCKRLNVDLMQLDVEDARLINKWSRKELV